MFFANGELFKECVLEAVAKALTSVSWVVVAAEPLTSVDITAADFLEELDEALHQDGIKLCFAELKDPVKDKLRRFGLFARFEKVFFPTIEEAVDRYLETHKLNWVDSEEDKSPARKKAVGDLEGAP